MPKVGANRAEQENEISIRFGSKSDFCSLCGAWRGSLGLEPTFELYLKHLMQIFDEVKRVLKPTGTCFVNLGDCYFTKSGGKFENDTLNKKTPMEISATTGINKAVELRNTPSTKLTNEQRAWLAALIDGEGSLQIHKQLRNNTIPSYQADVSVGMKDKEMVIYAHKITGLGSLTLQKRGVWDWGIRGQEAGKLVSLIYPYLFLKKQQAKCLYALCKNLKRRNGKDDIEFRDKLRELVKKLNQRKIDNVEISEPQQIISSVQSKSLCAIPERFKIMMIDKGWICRNTIIWYKRNCMPSSASDRFTVDFEYVYFFVKNQKYWFEQQFESYNGPMNRWGGEELKAKGESIWDEGTGQNTYRDRNMRPTEQGRNKRCVWDVTTQPYSEAHFATFPEKLVEPMIRSGCPKYICKKCGKAREKIVKTDYEILRKGKVVDNPKVKKQIELGENPNASGYKYRVANAIHTIKGYTDCGCNAGWEGGIVLDPFIGSGTVAKVAKRLKRNWIGIELNPEYIKMAKKRIKHVQTELF